jgi:tetratricopeptide (TPR) repeat protein
MKQILIAGLVLAGSAVARAADDRVTYLDPAMNKEVEVLGTIEEETPAGLKLKTRMGPKVIPALDVRSVIYQSTKVTALEFRQPVGKEMRALQPGQKPAERLKLLEEAIQGYRAVDAQLKDEANPHRYLQYRIAAVQALLAQGDPTRLDAAITALTAFKTDFATGWEIVPSLKLLAQLLQEKGDVEAASKVYEELTSVPDLPKEIKQESEVLMVRLLLHARKYAAAETKVKSLKGSLPKDSPQQVLLDICLVQSQMAQGNLAQAEPQLLGVLKVSNDPAQRGVVHNLLGDYWLQKERPEDAFWHYLRVDVLYNQDREEHAKALYQLSKLFDKVKRDPIRAEECHKRLLSADFTGTSYQRRATEEKK